MPQSSASVALPVLKEYKGPKCPYYGFRFDGSRMRFVDNLSDHCGLMRKGETCVLEAVDKEPNWDRCPLSKIALFGGSITDMTVHSTTMPIRLDTGCPPGTIMPTAKWHEHVMGRPFSVSPRR